MTTTRRLAADVSGSGYSRLIGVDEAGTLQAFKDVQAEVFDPKIAEHHSRLVKTTGDGFLTEFSSVVDALHCATEVRAQMAERNATVSTDQRIDFRIGINVGDIVVEDGDIFGDGVNVAVRLESSAKPGGISVSVRVQEDAVGKLDLSFEDMGEKQLKNIALPVDGANLKQPFCKLHQRGGARLPAMTSRRPAKGAATRAGWWRRKRT